MLKKILLGIMALIATAAIGMLLLSLATLITGEGPGIYEILILIIVALMAPFGFTYTGARKLSLTQLRTRPRYQHNALFAAPESAFRDKSAFGASLDHAGINPSFYMRKCPRIMALKLR